MNGLDIYSDCARDQSQTFADANIKGQRNGPPIDP